jgi:hypothetical protein
VPIVAVTRIGAWWSAAAGCSFRGSCGGGEAMITDFRKLLDRISIAAGFSKPVLDAAGKPVRDS